MKNNNISHASILSESTKFHGEIQFDNILHIDGIVIGKIYAKNFKNSILLVGKNAIVKADIVADIIIVSGCLSGNVYAPQKLEIKKKAKFEGRIFTSNLIVHKDSYFHGNSYMTKHLTNSEKEKIKNNFLITNLSSTVNLLENLKEKNKNGKNDDFSR